MLEAAGTGGGDRWLPGAALNIAECALLGPAGRPALVHADVAAPADVATVPLGELRRRCSAVAAALRTAGYRPGARPCWPARVYLALYSTR